MEYITLDTESAGMAQILCCQCGVLIEPNPSSTCVNCLRGRIDIAAEIPKQAVIFSCRGCQRYLNPPDEWVYCELESRELLKLCLKKLKGMDRVRTTHAEFCWTEPHSKRIKVVVTVQKTLQCGTVLEQKFTVEFTVHHQMCNDCHRTEANNIWSAMVQVRQHGNNRKTFYYLEQLLIKHNTFKTVGYKPTNAGVDFQFATDSHARKLVDFIQSMLPVRTQHSKKLISHDIHSNVYNYKFTYGVEIVPLSKDSLVCLPKKLTQQLGSISSICLVHRVTSTVHLIDNNTGQVCDLSATVYFRNPFASICYPKELIEYIVMDIEILKENEKRSFPGQGAVSNKHVVADAWVVKACELGINDNPVHTRTHLGHILKPGDSVLGYNIADSNVNDVNFDKLDRDAVPDVFLVKKHYSGKAARRRARAWKLRHMGDAEQGIDARAGRDSANRDYDDFLDDLEEDPVLRQNVNIYKDANKIAVDTDDEADPSMPRITLAEMLDDLNIEDAEMNEV